MKRSCFTMIDEFGGNSQALAIAAEPAIGWTMLFAVTLAVGVFGIIWFG